MSYVSFWDCILIAWKDGYPPLALTRPSGAYHASSLTRATEEKARRSLRISNDTLDSFWLFFSSGPHPFHQRLPMGRCLRLCQLLLFSTDVELVDELYNSASRPIAVFSFFFLFHFSLVSLSICLSPSPLWIRYFFKASIPSPLCSPGYLICMNVVLSLLCLSVMYAYDLVDVSKEKRTNVNDATTTVNGQVHFLEDMHANMHFRS